MIDGKPCKILRRHLTTSGLTPDEYRARHGRKADYPMVAPTYSEARRTMAKSIGLGRKPGRVVEKTAADAAKAACNPRAPKAVEGAWSEAGAAKRPPPPVPLTVRRRSNGSTEFSPLTGHDIVVHVPGGRFVTSEAMEMPQSRRTARVSARGSPSGNEQDDAPFEIPSTASAGDDRMYRQLK